MRENKPSFFLGAILDYKGTSMKSLLASSVALMLILTGCLYVPTAQDHKKANDVAAYISAKFDRFEKRSEVEKTNTGKTYYVAPGRYPVLQFYEITDSNDISAIEKRAREALSIVGIEKVKLVFFEKQNMHCAPGGSCSRGRENALKELIVEK